MVNVLAPSSTAGGGGIAGRGIRDVVLNGALIHGKRCAFCDPYRGAACTANLMVLDGAVLQNEFCT